MKKEKYTRTVIFCDCFECPYNNHAKDYTCKKHEIYLDQGDCTEAKKFKNSKEE